MKIIKSNYIALKIWAENKMLWNSLKCLHRSPSFTSIRGSGFYLPPANVCRNNIYSIIPWQLPKGSWSTPFNFDVISTGQTYRSEIRICKPTESDTIKLEHRGSFVNNHYFIVGKKNQSTKFLISLLIIQEILHSENMWSSTSFCTEQHNWIIKYQKSIH